ncbi:hypothetical protein ACA910_008996 [Epithemia clementina (nom. ined.)]
MRFEEPRDIRRQKSPTMRKTINGVPKEIQVVFRRVNEYAEADKNQCTDNPCNIDKECEGTATTVEELAVSDSFSSWGGASRGILRCKTLLDSLERDLIVPSWSLRPNHTTPRSWKESEVIEDFEQYEEDRQYKPRPDEDLYMSASLRSQLLMEASAELDLNQTIEDIYRGLPLPDETEPTTPTVTTTATNIATVGTNTPNVIKADLKLETSVKTATSTIKPEPKPDPPGCRSPKRRVHRQRSATRRVTVR